MFGWLSKSTKSNLPEPTPLEAQKSRQIEQLRSFNQNVSEVHRDVEYRVNFVVQGTSISLFITLPPQFPQEPPSVRVSPQLSHPWVNERMLVTGCPGINDFVVHSDLGRVVKDIIEEFQKNPPVVHPQVSQYEVGSSTFQYSASGLPSSSALPSYKPPPPIVPGNTAMPTYTIPPVNSTPVNIPPVNSTPVIASATSHLPGYTPQTNNATSEISQIMTEIQELSTEDLQELSENEDKLLELLKNQSQVLQISQLRANICSQNEELAKSNLSQKPFLEEQKQLLLDKYDELNEMKARFDELSQRQEAVRNRYDFTTLQNSLKVSAAEAEEEAEATADRFLQGGLGIEEFTKQFMAERKVGHLRRAKEEKLTREAFHL